jgi:hypothetical protein
MRIRVSELQGGSQCIHKSSMLRFHSSIDLADVVLMGILGAAMLLFMRHTISPPETACVKTATQQAFPTVTESELILSKTTVLDDTGRLLHKKHR